MTQKQAINLLTETPYKLGHLLGFTKLTTLHNNWIRSMVLGDEDETLQAHRGAFKTTCVALALLIIIILFPDKRILFIRKAETDVKEIIEQVQKMLKDKKTKYIVKCIYGIELRLTKETATEITTNLQKDNKGTAQLTGYGIGSSLTGKHYDYIFTDDIVTKVDRKSRAMRQETIDVYQELENLKNSGGKIYNTGTPWHKEDAFTIMPAPKKYDCYTTGLMTKEEIAYKKERQSPSLFCANYELRHVASEKVIFADPKTNEKEALVIGGRMHIDSAFFGDDWTALTIITKKGDNYFIYGRTWRKHVEECYNDIIAIYKKFLCCKLYSEDNADKGLVVRDLKNKGRTIGLRAHTYHESMNKYMKIVTYLKNVWPNLYFVEGTDEEYIKQILDYTEDADHDDCPDSASSAVRLLYNKKNAR